MYAGKKVIFRKLDINGAGMNKVNVSRGERINLNLDFFYKRNTKPDTYCPGCKVQIYLFIKDNSDNTILYWYLCNTYCPKYQNKPCQREYTNRTKSFNAPDQAGEYYINYTGTLQYSCKEWATGRTSNVLGNNTIDVITVN